MSYKSSITSSQKLIFPIRILVNSEFIGRLSSKNETHLVDGSTVVIKNFFHSKVLVKSDSCNYFIENKALNWFKLLSGIVLVIVFLFLLKNVILISLLIILELWTLLYDISNFTITDDKEELHPETSKRKHLKIKRISLFHFLNP